MEFSLVLGSSSKWRKNILASFLGPAFPFTSLNPDIDEKAIRHPDPRKMTLAIAKAKAEALKTKLNNDTTSHPTFLICSDQVIIYRGEVREKPENEEEARAFLRSYKEAPAEAVVAVVVYNTKTGLFFEGIATATQHFQELPESFIDQLIAQGDVMWCAGGFTVEEMTPYLGKREGEEETIQGMPIALTLELLRLAGLKGLPSVPAAIASEASCFAIRLPCEGPHGTHRVAIHIFDPPTGRREEKEEKESKVTLCVHGLSRNASDFEPLARMFAERRGQRVLAVDLPGRGLSDWFENSEDYNYPQYLSDLHTILTALGYVTPTGYDSSGSCGSKNNVDWVGTSLGGLLGMFYVGLHPGVVRRLLMNDIGPVVPLAGLQRLGSYVGEKVEFPTLGEVEQYFRTKFTPFGKLTDEEWRKIAVRSVIKSTCSPSSPWVLSYDPAIGEPFKDQTKFTTDMEMWPVWEKMEGSGVQILLLRGENSDLLTLKTVQDMIQRRPGPGLVKFLQFKECGHVPPLLSSSQIQLVLDFFTTPNESLTPLDSLP